MKITLSFLLIFLYSSAMAQDSLMSHEDSLRTVGHVYYVNFWKSIATTAIGQTARYLGSKTFTRPAITNAEFDLAQTQTSKDAINPLDRWVLNLKEPTTNLAPLSLQVQIIDAIVPLTLFFGERYRKNWDDIILMLMETNTLAECAFEFLPFGPEFQTRFRPIVYFAKDSGGRASQNTNNNRRSLFSGHTNSAAASMFFMAKVYCDYNPQIQGWDKIGIYSLASIPVLVMGYVRIIALQHFPTDVIIGGVVGGLCGILVPEIHKIDSKSFSMGVYSNPNSTGINMAWNIK